MSEHNYWQRMRRRQMSRRALLGASARAGVGAAGLALVGCGDDDDDATAQVTEQEPAATDEQTAEDMADQAEQPEPTDEPADQTEEPAVAATGPKFGGTLRLSGTIETHDYWDPHRGVFGPTQFMLSWMYNYGIRWQNKEQGIMEADLMALPEIPDDTTYIFSMDPAARWHDSFPTEGGRNVTADDIVVNVQRQVDGADSTGAEDGTFLLSTNFRTLASFEAVDEATFRMTTPGPSATILNQTFLNPFAYITSPEAIDEWGKKSDVWRDETTTLRESGSGPHLGVDFDPTTVFRVARNPIYWKPSAVTGQALPYLDGFEYFNIFDQTAAEAAFRNKQLEGVSLNSQAIDGLLSDFGDSVTLNQVAGGFTIIIRLNYNPEWPGEDNLGNPWVDRRVAAAYHAATDRFLMIDTVYQGDAKVSALDSTPWFSTFWAPPEEELLTWPGYRPDHSVDLQLANELMDASGFRDEGREFYLISPDVWEQQYPGIVETTKAMYESALGITVNIDLQPYTVILQRLEEGTEPGDIPAWTNPPSDLDPTVFWSLGRVPGASANLYTYEHPRVTEIVEQMQVTLDINERKVLADEGIRIMMGVETEGDWSGLSPTLGVMNPISKSVIWSWYHPNPDIYQFAHSGHNYDKNWIDVDDPGYPA